MISVQSYLNFTAILLLLVIAILNLALELRRDLMMLQQNSYRGERYYRWLRTSCDTTSWVRLFTYIALGCLLLNAVPVVAACVIAVVPLLCNVMSLAKARYKKPLVWTQRAKRIYCVAAAICISVLAAAVCFNGLSRLSATIAVALYALSHVVILAAVTILMPIESYINKKYYNEARSILQSMPDMKVIGITGSYGKTSTKHYLTRILNEEFNVLMTPGSYNTPMGVIRTIREMMHPYTEIFVCEMGAKNIGDIKEICDLVDPDMGIITAVGEQHLESFKTIENVQRTKFELADALPANGVVYVNNDFEYCASRKVDNTCCVRYGVANTNGADYYADHITYSSEGTTFKLHCPDKTEVDFTTRLVGECNISNLIPAIAVAMKLGMPTDKIRNAVSRIEQVEHRLNLKRTPAGVTIIDDAFNSNPDGSRMALDVLSRMTGGKRIVVTPGMIELGDKQFEYNRAFGQHMASCADLAIIVGQYNRDAILSGLKEGGMDEALVLTPDTFTQAQAIILKEAKRGDTVLYENDLPDTFK
ncbi:MAG: UDP-N-acetylmuramoyl-tripeptide--D-alanyl-D-alanine ligase [Muribaculum sp.]|nr:UDP-N-acetylmuramoyl-tripeptide--D-alanyl-D-alanine ligase [Muribaculaceae bacterium]MCM1080547.1 UDP-N-acetylmuramoyl-tripeptide--D-alanyl-D-alanine ligase [Muribaculum sp.]